MHALPAAHLAFLDRAMAVLRADARIEAIVISGSAVTGGVDAWSDLDLVVLVDDAAEPSLTQEHFSIARRLGVLLQAVRAEHFGEPRLLICLYDQPLLHVDLKFMALRHASTLTYATELLWSRGLPPTLPPPASARQPDAQWYADALPGAAHYLAVKIGRGELFEAVNSLAFLRSYVLAPLIALEAGNVPRGLRRLEETRSPRLGSLARTLCGYDRGSIAAASEEALDLAASLLDAVAPHVERNRVAEARARAFLREVCAS